MNSSGGIASFTDLKIDRGGSDYTLSFSGSGLVTAVTSVFDIIPASATSLQFFSTPSGGTAGSTSTLNTVVYVTDSLGNLVTDAFIDITMSLTTPGCSMGDYMAQDIKSKISGSIKEAGNINVTVTFDPQWEPSMMTDHARDTLGFPQENNSTKEKVSDKKDEWE